MITAARQSIPSLQRVLLSLAILALLLRLAFWLPSYFSAGVGEFVAYFVSAQVVADGGEAARFYDDGWFLRQSAARGYAGANIYYPNPPTTALLFLPISRLEFGRARLLWGLLSLVFAGVSLAIMLRAFRPSGRATLLAIAIALLSQPFKADLYHGQIYSFVLLLLTLAWLGFRQGKQALCGAACAAMALAKLFGAPLWLLLLARRSWRALAVGLLALAAVVLASLPLLGLEVWRAFALVPLRITNDPTLVLTAFQSLQSLIGHLFTLHPALNPRPIADAPIVATVLLWAAQALIVGVICYTALASEDHDLSFASVACASVFLSPFAQDYTYTLLLLPIVVLIARLDRRQAPPYAWLIAGLGILLIALNLPLQSPAFQHGYWALLAYPKLFGALIVWALLIWQALACRRQMTRCIMAPAQ